MIYRQSTRTVFHQCLIQKGHIISYFSRRRVKRRGRVGMVEIGKEEGVE